MDNQLPTLHQLNDSRKNAMVKVKENLNYIYITLMVIANCLISLLKIEDGVIALRYPQDGVSWVMWLTQILLITFIGVMILGAFRRQGIKLGLKSIKDTYDEYLKALSLQASEIKPRSVKEYLSGKTLKDSAVKGPILAISSLVALSMTISANLNSILSLIINIILSCSFGIKALLESEEYVITELVIWYKIKIRELTAPKEKKNGETSRNKQPRSRSSKSSRI